MVWTAYVNIIRPDVLEALRFAVEEYGCQNKRNYEVRTIYEATEEMCGELPTYMFDVKLFYVPMIGGMGPQVVSGGMYELDVKIVQKGEDGAPDSEGKDCTFRIWSQPWMGPDQLDSSC